MIDLRSRKLPDEIVIDGKPYSVKTDFRLWMEVNDELKKGKCPYWIFANDKPPFLSNWIKPVMEFLASANATPAPSNDSVEKLFDFIMDGDYIVAAFQQAYGIDLTSEEMHWHRFLALFKGLPDEVKLSKIMSYRGYKADKRKHETIMQQLKREWRLPRDEREKRDIIEWQKKTFEKIGKGDLNG